MVESVPDELVGVAFGEFLGVGVPVVPVEEPPDRSVSTGSGWDWDLADGVVKSCVLTASNALTCAISPFESSGW